ncbi:MAG: phosphoribosyltransferase [Oscillatoriales cyanobacterium]|nr:MAG: phosphoribosyltransferase [Oscillatoriales cyanobacterium]
MGTDFYVSWTDYHQAIERLALRVHRSGWQFDSLVCLARGGLRVGDVLSRLFRKRLAILSVSSYGGDLGRDRGELAFAHSLSMVGDRLGPRLLVVDDLADSGATLQASVQWLRDRYDLAEIRTAALWVKGCSVIVPDYYDRPLPHNPWIHQPFERYETLDLAALDRAHSRDE